MSVKRRRIGFEVIEDRFNCPVVVPIDLETGQELEGVRMCEVSCGVDRVTVMKLEILVMGEKHEPRT